MLFQDMLSQITISPKEQMSPIRIMREVSGAQHMLRDVIHYYKHQKDQEKAMNLLATLTEKVESLFDELEDYNFSFVELESLTKLCRRINEDPVIEEIRSFGRNQEKVQNLLTNTANKLKKCQDNNSKPQSTTSTATNSLSSLATSRPISIPLNKSTPLQRKKLSKEHNRDPDEKSQINFSINKNSKASFYSEGLSRNKELSDDNTIDGMIEAEIFSISIRNDNSERSIREKEENLNRVKFETLLNGISEEFKESRIDQANRYLTEMKKFIQNDQLSLQEKMYFQSKLEENNVLINDIEVFYEFASKILHELEEDQGYHLEISKKNLDIKAKSRPTESPALKMETIVPVPLKNLLSTFYEADGYASWSPFCKESKEFKKLLRAGNAMWLKWQLPPPITNREGYVIGLGFDRIKENGTFLLISKTINDDKQLQKRFGIHVPDHSKLVRMEIPYSGVELTPISKDRTKMKIVTMFDMKLKMVPKSLMNWIIKKGASYLVERIVKTAVHQNVTRNSEFYIWLDNLINRYLDTKNV